MQNNNLKKISLKIHGMHCASCEVLIERKWREVPGVERVEVNHTNGKAEIIYSQEPKLDNLQELIKDDGYTLSRWEEKSVAGVIHKNGPEDYMEIGMIFLLVVALYLALSGFHLLPSLGITQDMSYGFVFLIGLVAATSTCIAVTGGLLLAVAAKYNERYPYLSGGQKLKPHLYFNVGRIVSYTVLGGAVGALGSVLALSTEATGLITIAASVVMIVLGLQLLKFFPALRRFQPRMPKFLAHKIHDLQDKDSKAAPFLLGAGTFFLPCGFTQALQLYVLSKGSFTVGALTMLAFSIGTLPVLMSLSAISSFAKGTFQRIFLRFAAIVVIILGFFSINNGLTLAGYNFDLASMFGLSNSAAQANAPAAQIVDGKQIVKMKVNGYSYEPNQFTVVQGVPVEWQIDGAGAVGCGQVLVMPTLGISKYLSPQGITTITFTPKDTGTIPFNCSMGMMTRGSAFTVVPNTSGIQGVAVTNTTDQTNIDDPNAQKLSMEISRERGFYPNSLTVKKGVPVELTIDDQVPLGGCMSVMVIPKYGVSVPLKIGQNKLAFTPTETGVVPVTCPMGGRMTQFVVTD